MEVSGNFMPQLLYSWGRTLVPKAGWAPELVWTFWRREKFLCPTGIRTLDRPAHSLVAVLPMLPCFLILILFLYVSNVCPSERAAGETWFSEQPFNEPVLLQVHCESTPFIQF
jgi:hypothetical protein